MGKITGFLEIERHDRVYAPVEELCVPKTSSGDDFGFCKQNPCSSGQNSLFLRNNSLFCCVGNFAASL